MELLIPSLLHRGIWLVDPVVTPLLIPHTTHNHNPLLDSMENETPLEEMDGLGCSLQMISPLQMFHCTSDPLCLWTEAKICFDGARRFKGKAFISDSEQYFARRSWQVSSDREALVAGACIYLLNID